MLARGAADDKGQIHAPPAWAEALLTTAAPPVNLRFVFEGEEEIGASTSIEAGSSQPRPPGRGRRVISDTGFFEGNLPAITIGLRGLMYAQIDVVGPPIDLHSGGYGGEVENPANALAAIIAALKGPDGRIRIPGFYDEVVPLTDAEREALAELPFDEEAYRADIGVPALVGEAGFTTLERRGARPTLDVNGIWGGFQGEGSKTIIPAHAHAKVSCRLVSDQDPDRIFEQSATSWRDRTARRDVDVRDLDGGRPELTPIDHPATKAAARASRRTFGRGRSTSARAARSRCGRFDRVLGLPVVLLGFTQPDDNAHAPNEWMDLDNYELASGRSSGCGTSSRRCRPPT